MKMREENLLWESPSFRKELLQFSPAEVLPLFGSIVFLPSQKQSGATKLVEGARYFGISVEEMRQNVGWHLEELQKLGAYTVLREELCYNDLAAFAPEEKEAFILTGKGMLFLSFFLFTSVARCVRQYLIERWKDQYFASYQKAKAEEEVENLRWEIERLSFLLQKVMGDQEKDREKLVALAIRMANREEKEKKLAPEKVKILRKKVKATGRPGAYWRLLREKYRIRGDEDLTEAQYEEAKIWLERILRGNF